MQDNLAVADGKVVDAMLFGETIGMKVMPFFRTLVTLIKMNVDYTTFQTRFFNETGVFLFYIDDFKDIENAFGEDNAYECLVCERCVGVFCHGAKLHYYFEQCTVAR